ncbi:hypothetical protein E0I26_02855 [Flavobacterium rhamnosiphilum]|uniref:FUSC family protein n=1 Tax=Flavobacterium rhamnosiphilum TaxID=2541724 RepID=A0A4V2Z9T0_9FLAO|nr:hypothetical protein [Flavobacterium rhamnosiphilum]TDE47044.1 hypothetical protein E0I26_02855 [Flavobacterium rhamnosiphilum]
MKTKRLTDLTEQELIIEQKKRKSISTSYSFIMGMMIGITVYGFIKNGLSFFSLLPIIFLPIFIMNWNNYKEVKNEIKSRNIT